MEQSDSFLKLYDNSPDKDLNVSNVLGNINGKKKKL